MPCARRRIQRVPSGSHSHRRIGQQSRRLREQDAEIISFPTDSSVKEFGVQFTKTLTLLFSFQVSTIPGNGGSTRITLLPDEVSFFRVQLNGILIVLSCFQQSALERLYRFIFPC
jgi:hypothetical protein